MFFDFQAEKISEWLLNPAMWGVVVCLMLMSTLRGVEKHDRRFWHETGNDLIYGIIWAALYFPLIALTLEVVNAYIDAYHPYLRLNLIQGAPAWMVFITIVLVDDFLEYWGHRLRHSVKFLWYFHSVHHSQERLNPFTTKRFHPLENLFVKVVIVTVPAAMIGGTKEMLLTYFLLDAAWDYFIHSNVRTNLGPLRHIVVTPQFHRVHHSRQREHFDGNYGGRLIIWDVMFGTAFRDREVYPACGVKNYPIVNQDGFPLKAFVHQHLTDLAYPFRMMARDISAWLRKSRPEKT